eukprot:10628066-Lingulodinium_polyedra.AAC.1
MLSERPSTSTRSPSSIFCSSRPQTLPALASPTLMWIGHRQRRSSTGPRSTAGENQPSGSAVRGVTP